MFEFLFAAPWIFAERILWYLLDSKYVQRWTNSFLNIRLVFKSANSSIFFMAFWIMAFFIGKSWIRTMISILIPLLPTIKPLYHSIYVVCTNTYLFLHHRLMKHSFLPCNMWITLTCNQDIASLSMKTLPTWRRWRKLSYFRSGVVLYIYIYILFECYLLTKSNVLNIPKAIA